MLPRFENGIKFLLLLLLTNVTSRSYSDKKQEQDDQGPSQVVQVDQDQKQWAQQRDVAQWTKSQRDEAQWTQTKRGPAQWTIAPRDESEGGYVGQILNLGQSQSQGNQRERTYSDRGNFLSRLLNSRQGPVVVFLTPGTDVDLDGEKSSLKSDDVSEEKEKADEEPNEVYVPQPGENDAYVLYNVLRTTQEDEDLDPQANEAFEKTKEVLRAAFALRCGARATCEEKCPEKKPKCPTNCQKVERKAKNDCTKKCPEKPRCERKCERIAEEKVDECEQKVDECEQKQEKKCEAKCSKIYDELDACPKQKKSCGPKCGKTMPPNRWLLRARNLLL